MSLKRNNLILATNTTNEIKKKKKNVSRNIKNSRENRKFCYSRTYIAYDTLLTGGVYKPQMEGKAKIKLSNRRRRWIWLTIDDDDDNIKGKKSYAEMKILGDIRDGFL